MTYELMKKCCPHTHTHTHTHIYIYISFQGIHLKVPETTSSVMFFPRSRGVSGFHTSSLG